MNENNFNELKYSEKLVLKWEEQVFIFLLNSPKQKIVKQGRVILFVEDPFAGYCCAGH